MKKNSYENTLKERMAIDTLKNRNIPGCFLSVSEHLAYNGIIIAYDSTTAKRLKQKTDCAIFYIHNETFIDSASGYIRNLFRKAPMFFILGNASEQDINWHLEAAEFSNATIITSDHYVSAPFYEIQPKNNLKSLLSLVCVTSESLVQA